MAQWLGQYLGHAHATRVDEAEQTLRLAVVGRGSTRAAEPAADLKALQRLAERVLRARLQRLKASLAATRRLPTAEAMEKRAAEFERLRAARDAALAGGADAVLREFGVDVPDDVR